MVLLNSKPNRVWRVFHCRRCNHHLRFGVTSCGHCYRITPIKNWWLTWIVLAAALIAGIVRWLW